MRTEFENKTHFQQYVEFFYPGFLLAETGTQKVESRNTDALKIPENAYAFRFFSRMECNTLDRLLQGPPEDYSGMFYPGGSIFSPKEVKRQFPGEKVLISKMEISGYSHIVKTKAGNFAEYDPKKDKIL